MDPNVTLEILRATVAEFRALTDASEKIEHADDRLMANIALIDLGDTLAEAFDALDGWLTKEGSVPAAWGRCW